MRYVWFCLLMGAAAAYAQSLLPGDLSNSYSAAGEAEVAWTASAGPGFGSAFRISTVHAGRELADASLAFSNTVAVAAGDRLLVSFWVRKVAPDDVFNIRGTLSVEGDGAPALLETVFPCSLTTWTKYAYPVVAARAYDPGELRVVFRHGLGPQTYEMGGLQWISRGQPAAAPTPLRSLIPADSTHAYSAYFDNSVGGGSARVVTVEGAAFTEAVEVRVNGTSSYIYNAQLGWVTTAPVAKNDAVVLSFYFRLMEGKDGGPAQGQIVFERNADPYDKSVTYPFPVADSEWQLLQVPFRANDNYAPGAAHLQLQFAAGPQRFQFAKLELLNYGPVADLSVLPSRQSSATDPQRAQLLADARARIAEMRQVPLTVTVTDANGDPVPGAEVRVQQLRHAFRFGSAVTANGLKQPGQDNEIYRSRIASHFTTAVLENDLKWPPWECTTCKPSYDQQQTRDGIQWLLDRGIPVRGHNLIWPSFRNMPTDIQRLKGEELRGRITKHFENVLSDSGLVGKLYQWDVVNEPFDNYVVQGRVGGVSGVPQSDGLLGNTELLAWFRKARALAPDAQLVLNDYTNIEAAGRTQHEDYTIRVIEWMRENGAPLDALGLQAHFGGARTLTRMQAVIDRFGAYGLPLAITEFDFNTSDEAAQAEFTRDFMTLVFSRAEFTDFLMWGFWASRHWLPQGAMYAADWTSKQNALVYTRLLFQEWWTHATAQTGDAGSATVSIYRGDHQVTVWGPDGPVSQVVRATDSGTVNIQLK